MAGTLPTLRTSVITASITLSVILTSLAGIGVGHPLLEVLNKNQPPSATFANMTRLTGRALIAGIVAGGIFAILRGLYQHHQTERVALEALSAVTAFRTLLAELRNVLSDADPMSGLQDLRSSLGVEKLSWGRIFSPAFARSRRNFGATNKRKHAGTRSTPRRF